MREHTANHASTGKGTTAIIRVLVLSIAAVFIFASGIAIGNGTITFGSTKDVQVNKDLPENLDYTSVEQMYDILRKNYNGKLTTSQLLDGLKKGLAEATGDPYTEYFNPQDAKDFEQVLDGSFTGIGAELSKDSDGNLIVISPIAGFPAEKAGLRAQDILLKINGESTSGLSVSDAVNKIRGPKGSEVKLDILRNKTDSLTFTIVRADIKVPSVEWKILDGNIGYIRISQFSNDTTDLTTQAAREFQDKKVGGVVLDLRGNPGGLLTAAVGVSSLWLQNGKTVLQEKRAGVVTHTYTANGNDFLNGVKTVVLIDAGSASASEITAGALHDNGVATLIGQKSYGKGVVQEIMPLPRGAEFKVTVAQWIRPNGENIDKKGITPDKDVKLTEDDFKQGKDPQKDAALDFLRGQ